MRGTEITRRQQAILSLLEKNGPQTRAGIAHMLPPRHAASRISIIRDLHALIDRGLVRAEGRGRSVRYAITHTHPLLAFIDLALYFEDEPDRRMVQYTSFDPSVFEEIGGVIGPEERAWLDEARVRFMEMRKQKRTPEFARELERFIVELSWKSSAIEGNTYSLLETEALLTNQRTAPGHAREEAIMILNHKAAFELILKNPGRFRTLTPAAIRAMHATLVKDLAIARDIRSHPVGITGTLYRPPDNRWQIEDALGILVKAVNAMNHPVEKALAILTGIAAIQPFPNGNKRTSRMVSNALLFAHGCYPLSYRSIDDIEYKQAIIVFFEQHSLYHLKRLFLEQCRFASETYFR